MKKHYQQLFSTQWEIEYWDSIYDQQDFYGDCYRERIGTALSWLASLNLSEDSKILEVGCGAGRFAEEATRMGLNVLGVDYSQGMLTKASSRCNRKNILNITFLQGNIESLPLRDSSFDVIICLGVISYLKSEEKALQELARVEKPGGVLVLSILNKARLIRVLDLPFLLMHLLQKMISVIIAKWSEDAYTSNALPLKSYFIPEFQKSLELVGFTVLENKTIPYELLTLFGKDVFPQKVAAKITLFIEKFRNIPVVGSFGGMCVFKAVKNS